MQNVLVTGGAGFLGSHLVEALVGRGYKVSVLDNLSSGRMENLDHLKENLNLKFIEGDVNDDFSKEDTFDFIFHLASPASPVDYQKHPEETLLTNSMGTLRILKMANSDKSKILVASTSEIYGDPKDHPQKESYFGNVNTFGPRACYDESKRFAEAATYVYMNKYGIDARIVRIFNTYGPRMQKDDGRVISNFINHALSDSPIEIDGDGTQTRSFCYVSDMVEGFLKAMFSDGTKGKIYNLGNPDEYLIKDLAEKIIKLTGSKSEVTMSGSFREDDPMRRCPDISKAKQDLGWEPKVHLDEGLIKTIEYYRSH